MKTALVLSAGGMFGAYQAGVWKALAPVFRPDMVVGASIGALNGWAIAGGCSPERLIERWLDLERFSKYRLRFPRSVRHGVLDSSPLQSLIEELYREFTPELEYGAVVTDTLRLRPMIVRSPDVEWQHIAASAAMVGLFPQHRIEGRMCSDGGLLSALPIWAAVEMGAQRIVAVNVLPRLPGTVIRTAVRILQSASRFRPQVPASVETIHITAPAGLGSVKDSLYWKRDNAERWIEQGESDAREMLTASGSSPQWSPLRSPVGHPSYPA